MSKIRDDESSGDRGQPAISEGDNRNDIPTRYATVWGNGLADRLVGAKARWEVYSEDDEAEKAWAGELLHDFKHDGS
jgi:hypothetical protein